VSCLLPPSSLANVFSLFCLLQLRLLLSSRFWLLLLLLVPPGGRGVSFSPCLLLQRGLAFALRGVPSRVVWESSAPGPLTRGSAVRGVGLSWARCVWFAAPWVTGGLVVRFRCLPALPRGVSHGLEGRCVACLPGSSVGKETKKKKPSRVGFAWPPAGRWRSGLRLRRRARPRQGAPAPLTQALCAVQIAGQIRTARNSPIACYLRSHVLVLVLLRPAYKG
jgi:hypothetical protein